jgi:hypothetical protein
MRETLTAWGLLGLLVLLAGCSSGAGGAPGPLASTGATSPSTATSASATNTTAPPPPAEEVLNQTFTFQMGASVPAATFEVAKPWRQLNLTAALRNTSQCYLLFSEARAEGTVSQPAVAVTSPSGRAFEVPLLAAAGCQPASPPDFLAPASLDAPAEQGTWTVQPRGWGENMDLLFVARGLP